MAEQSSASAKATGRTETCASARARLLIVDDHHLIRSALSELLNREPDMCVAWEAADTPQALSICNVQVPDLAIVDIELRGISGIELVKEMKKNWPGLPVLVISIHEELLFMERAMQAGARGYLTKSAATNNVADVVRLILDGQSYVSEDMRAAMSKRSAGAGDGTVMSALNGLSDRELEVFRLIGQDFKKGEIASCLQRSINTVEAHRSNIKKKLKVNTGNELQRIAFLISQQQC